MGKTFYIFHGEDTLSLQEAVATLRQNMGEYGDLNTSLFDGQSVTVPELINAASSMPFLAAARLVIVRDLLGWISRRGAGEAGKKATRALEDALPTLPETARLVFVEHSTLDDKNPLLRLAQSHPNGYLKHFGVPKDLAAWIIRRAREEYDADIHPAAASALAGVVGDDLRIADNELVKLVSYVPPGERITEEHVATLTPYVAEANLYKMVDAIAEGRGQMALNLLHRLLREKDNNPFSLFGMITRQFRLLLLTREILDEGGAVGDVMSRLKQRDFVARNLVRQARAFSLPQLEAIFRRLQAYDYEMKVGKIQPELALDLFIASLTTQ